MRHSTTSSSEQRAPSQNRAKTLRDHSVDSREATTEKFPDFESSSFYTSSPAQQGRSASGQNGFANSAMASSGDVWRPRRESSALRGGRGLAPGHSGQPFRGHGRQKSINEALQNIRVRGGSVSQNAHEIADALRAPVSPRLIVRYIHKHTRYTSRPRALVLMVAFRSCASCGTARQP